MRKKIALIMILTVTVCLLSGCMMVSGAGLESMFGTGESKERPAVSDPSASGNTVTISKDEYERYQSLQKFSELEELYYRVQQEFYQEPDTEQMLEYASRGLLAGLGDPYTFYYSPDEFEEMFKDDEGKYVGIGVMILSDVKNERCVISRVFKGSPAEEAGVLRGDVLYRVEDDLYVTPENLSEAVNIMRGEPGTSVNVTFLRNGEEITFNIGRREVNVNQVESTMLEDGIGYIALYEFAGEAEKEFEKALKELSAKDAKGIIIDLRDNHGGWVVQAEYIADLFLDSGELCYLVNRAGEEDHETYRTEDGKTDVKLVILVNEMSASSSEILTGALRDRGDATVVGTLSFGKGIVQSLAYVGNKGAGYQITIAEYYTPGGNKVHGVGITPDVIVERPEDDAGNYDFADTVNDVQLNKALEVMRDKLK